MVVDVTDNRYRICSMTKHLTTKLSTLIYWNVTSSSIEFQIVAWLCLVESGLEHFDNLNVTFDHGNLHIT